jgi:two-component system response regulator AtoC
MAELVALILEDDETFRESVELLVQREGFKTISAGTIAEARQRLCEIRPDVALVDLSLPDGDGLAFLQNEEAAAGVELILVTGNASVDSAIDALRGGVLDYLVKPIDRGRLRAALANVSRTRALKSQVRNLRGELRELGRFGRMVGGERMQAVYDAIARVAPTNATVLITGESGTGKEVAAQTIHELSVRAAKPMLPVNCGAVSPNLIESELFGHEKGSFTGADRVRKGYFEQADGGTMFLDEITEMPIELQVKLLRVLETGIVMRVGGTTPIPVDVRVIAATNRDPHKAVDAGALREDLFYRLNVFPIALPPLRERGNDVELLAQHFLRQLNRDNNLQKRWSVEGLERLRKNAWRGNVRELRNVVQRAFILADDVITPDVLPPPEVPLAEATPSTDMLQVRFPATIADVEKRLILATLDQLQGDKRRAADLLGISLKTLYNRLNVYEASERPKE